MNDLTSRPVTASSTIPVTVTSKFSGSTAVTDDLVVHMIRKDTHTYIAAAVANELMPKVICVLEGTREKMLVDAVNNRTRERNYYQLYSRLLENEISEEEFDREINEHPDDYVISTDKVPSEVEFNEALALADHIKGVETSGDIETLFSFRGDEFNEYCKKLLNGSL